MSVSPSHFIEFIKSNLNNERLSDSDFRELLRDTINIVSDNKKNEENKKSGGTHEIQNGIC